MPTESAKRKSFLAWYAETIPLRSAAADEVRNWMKDRMSALGIAVDSVSARAKDLRSVRGKLREKKYREPKQQLTDMIGARVVLLFDSEVATAEMYLRKALEVSDRYSRIAGSELELAQFGYRSVHLVAKFPGSTMRSYLGLGRPWVEIQVRTILQHAWAAIGHDHLYKCAVSFPDSTKRRFFAIAGGLELFDRECDSVRAWRQEAHDKWMEAFRSGKRLGETLDITGVSGLFEHLFPGSKWSDSHDGRTLSPSIEIALIKCLKKAGVTKARDLRAIAKTRGFRRRLSTFASAVGTSQTGVANFAKCVLAIGTRKPRVLMNDFVELVEDARLREAILLK